MLKFLKGEQNNILKYLEKTRSNLCISRDKTGVGYFELFTVTERGAFEEGTSSARSASGVGGSVWSWWRPLQRHGPAQLPWRPSRHPGFFSATAPGGGEWYTTPQGLYPHLDMKLKKLCRLIVEANLTPCHPGSDDPRPDLDECPICCLEKPERGMDLKRRFEQSMKNPVDKCQRRNLCFDNSDYGISDDQLPCSPTLAK